MCGMLQSSFSPFHRLRNVSVTETNSHRRTLRAGYRRVAACCPTGRRLKSKQTTRNALMNWNKTADAGKNKPASVALRTVPSEAV